MNIKPCSMSKFISSIFIFSFLSNLSFAQNSFTITGIIDGAPNGTTVKLIKWDKSEDSTVINNHTFVFKGSLKEPTGAGIIAEAIIEGKKEIKNKLLYIENSQIKINGTWENFGDAIITGSLSDKDVRIYESGLKNTKTGTHYPWDTTAVNFTINFIKQHPDSYFAGLQLYLYRSHMPFNTVRTLYLILSDKIKASSSGLNLFNYIKENQQLKIGDVAPDFILTSINGEPIKLSSYKGKYLLINFWASWCAPCRAQHTRLINAYQKYHSSNFEILGIGLDKKDDLKKAISIDRLLWINAFESKGFDSRVAHAYDVWALPHNFLIGPTGKIISININDLQEDGLSQRINEALGK